VAVPDFQSLMLLLLRMAGDGAQHSMAEAREVLAVEFKLTQADRDELLPSGRVSRFANPVAWAKSYLQQAGLLMSPRRGHLQISARGRTVLESPPERIDIRFLGRYPEFVEIRSRSEVGKPSVEAGSLEPESDTPEEALEAAHLKMRAGLASEVLARVKAASPEFFERLVVEVAPQDGLRRLAQGYRSGNRKGWRRGD
jgi:restriction system protein